MCVCLIEVRYRNKTESDQHIPIADEEAFAKRMADLKKNDMVERLTVFRPAVTHKRSVQWDVTDHVATYEMPQI